MTHTPPPDIPALIGSRICHDLISPIGAIANGLELLEMTGSAQGPEWELIRDSVAQANARIRLFRIAFGAAAEGQMLNGGELGSALTGCYSAGRIALRQDLPRDLARAEGKLIALAVLCLETALPVGGTISIEADGPAFALTATGKRLNCEADHWQVMSGPSGRGEVGAAEIQFVLIGETAARTGRTLQTELGSEAISIRF